MADVVRLEDIRTPSGGGGLLFGPTLPGIGR